MFKVNEDMSIYVTRGDTALIDFGVTNKDGKAYTFKTDDVLRFKVFEKNGCDCVVLQKDFPIAESAESVELLLTGEDTKIGELINKPKDYWYEVELNPMTMPQTLVGYDEDGAKVFRLFPEGKDVEVTAWVE